MKTDTAIFQGEVTSFLSHFYLTSSFTLRRMSKSSEVISSFNEILFHAIQKLLTKKYISLSQEGSPFIFNYHFMNYFVF